MARPNISQSKCIMMRYGDTSTTWPQLIEVMVYETINNANWDSRATGGWLWKQYYIAYFCFFTMYIPSKSGWAICLSCPPTSGASLTDIIQRFSPTVGCGVPPNRMFKPRMQLILYSMEIKVYYINNTHKHFSSII